MQYQISQRGLGMMLFGTGLLTLILFSQLLSKNLASVHAAPYIPNNDEAILETLPLSGDPRQRQLRQWRQELSQDPENLPLAIRLANQYLRIGHTEADPRFDGYARAALLPWWNARKPPTEVLLIQAMLQQRGHQFDEALSDLKQVLDRQPFHPQAWLNQAVIHQVRGQYSEARKSCWPLMQLVNSLVSTSCVANISSVNGQAQNSYDTLLQSFNQNPSATPEEQLWALTILAETAARLGKHVQAEEHFKQALALNRKDTYLLGAYSDFLLDQNRAAEVLALLQDNIQPDGLLLRLTLATQRLQNPQFKNYLDSLSARFTDSRLRGDARHLREEARFTLHLLIQPQKALQLAQENWKVQREPWDTRIFLEAALLSGNTKAAQPVLDWLKTVKLEDQQITRLVEQFSMKPWVVPLVWSMLLLLYSSETFAHKPSDSYLRLTIDESTIQGQWDIALRDLDHAMSLDRNADGSITWGEVRAQHHAISSYVLSRLQVNVDDSLCSNHIENHLVDHHSDGAYAVFKVFSRLHHSTLNPQSTLWLILRC